MKSDGLQRQARDKRKENYSKQDGGVSRMFSRGLRLLRLHKFLEYPLDLSVALGKTCATLQKQMPLPHTSSSAMASTSASSVGSVGTAVESFGGLARRFDALAAAIAKRCGRLSKKRLLLVRVVLFLL
jgi:hypothetical protein